MQSRARYLIVDGHSIIFGWPELRKLHARRSSLAREALLKQLRDYQDWTGVHVVVVFDGKGKKVDATSDPVEVQVFYSRSGQSADAIIERLASKYAKRFELMVATSDLMEAETVQACGAEWISPDGLRGLLMSRGRGSSGIMVIPSEVEESRGLTVGAVPRDPSTLLRLAQDDGLCAAKPATVFVSRATIRVSSQSLLLARRVSRAGEPTQSVALLLRAARRATPTMPRR